MRIKYLSWLPAVFIMLIIFSFSAKPATISGESSLRISEYIMKLYEQITNSSLEVELRTEKLMDIDFIIRKGAHFTEYTILAVVICFPLMLAHGLGGWKLLLGSILITAAYAATDELHQTFVPGRSGQYSDVLLDTCGAVFGALLFHVIYLLFKGRKNREKIKAISE